MYSAFLLSEGQWNAPQFTHTQTITQNSQHSQQWPSPSKREPHDAMDIDSWTVSALQRLRISPLACGTSTQSAIPMDVDTPCHAGIEREQNGVGVATSSHLIWGEAPLQSAQDSQYQRLENDVFSASSTQPAITDRPAGALVAQQQVPGISDWKSCPTHQFRPVPDSLDPFWNHGHSQDVSERASTLKRKGRRAGEIPRHLKEMVKHEPYVLVWVRGLEVRIRQYLWRLQSRYQKRRHPQRKPVSDMDSDDESLAFAGRNGPRRDLHQRIAAQDRVRGSRVARRQMRRQVVRQAPRERTQPGLVFESYGEESASIKRWLTLAICDYYGLASRAVTLTSTPTCVYVGLRHPEITTGSSLMSEFPRPLWELC
ncbi:hypothetical protein E4U35_004288 [Claviceps purpurea]|uniref:Uncharacterized protein n=1 Tax=Claviceps purpurea (strain 20.1) TaxID=1111077 RepID=M1VWH1_CLAP2|nr:hypothetical protein E4U12_000711 [Claviceps purpurea]CCE31262.1 uncharacterized protein CPUR_05113 [Claviceps purpurea 20.1]KAG6171920.1 hypothetical protein E4U51_008124 [Claviceps purpurea]KAG6183088.1 hypothetical protein E4U36_002906 [Claviceps purpurea]KAG6196947.1 hypothetical protein E4U10_000512 [Claviceps purpurea]